MNSTPKIFSAAKRWCAGHKRRKFCGEFETPPSANGFVWLYYNPRFHSQRWPVAESTYEHCSAVSQPNFAANALRNISAVFYLFALNIPTFIATNSFLRLRQQFLRRFVFTWFCFYRNVMMFQIVVKKHFHHRRHIATSRAVVLSPR